MTPAGSDRPVPDLGPEGVASLLRGLEISPPEAWQRYHSEPGGQYQNDASPVAEAAAVDRVREWLRQPGSSLAADARMLTVEYHTRFVEGRLVALRTAADRYLLHGRIEAD